MQLIKRLTQTLSAGSTSLTFIDSMINNNSIIEIKTDSFGVYPINATQSGTSVTVQFDAQENAHSILLLINNIVSLSDPELATLLDVDLGTLSEDDILTYDETTEKWINSSSPTPDASDIEYDNSESSLLADNVQEAIDEVFQSVSDGKELIADAITDKGVTTSATDTFATMAENIASIPTGGGGDVVYDLIAQRQYLLDWDANGRVFKTITVPNNWSTYSDILFKCECVGYPSESSYGIAYRRYKGNNIPTAQETWTVGGVNFTIQFSSLNQISSVNWSTRYRKLIVTIYKSNQTYDLP